MNIKNVIRLAQVMSDFNLTELEIHDKDESVRLCANGSGSSRETAESDRAFSAVPAVEKHDDARLLRDTAADEDERLFITAPMPGTFFAAASPDGAPYVKTGTKVQEKSIVCIIEAMKVMNEVKAECHGTIVNVLVANGEAVEYGQKLFEVR